MESLGFALLHYRINLSPSRVVVLLLCPPLLLLMLAVIPHWGALVPPMRHSLSRVFEAGGPSTSVFFLLNALILTIIGSSKLEAARGKLMGEQEIEGRDIILARAEAVGAQLQEKNDGSREPAVHADNAAGGTDLTVGHSFAICPSLLTSGHGNDQSMRVQRRNLLVRSRSDDHLREKTSTKHADVVVAAVVNDQHKPFDRTRLRLARNYTSGREKARLPIPLNTLRHGLEQNKLTRGSFSNVHAVGEGSHATELASKKSALIQANKTRRPRRANKSMDHAAPALQTQLVPAAAAAHSSFDDVWAGIIAANAANPHHMHAANPCDENSSRGNNITQPLAAAAALPSLLPAVASEPEDVPPPSTAAAANAPKEAAGSAVATAEIVATATELTADVVAEKKHNAHDHEHDSELKELNRRAEKFIARFNHQMRIQRQESLQRRKHTRPCNHYMHHANYHVQHPSPGLLVG